MSMTTRSKWSVLLVLGLSAGGLMTGCTKENKPPAEAATEVPAAVADRKTDEHPAKAEHPAKSEHPASEHPE